VRRQRCLLPVVNNLGLQLAFLGLLGLAEAALELGLQALEGVDTTTLHHSILIELEDVLTLASPEEVSGRFLVVSLFALQFDRLLRGDSPEEIGRYPGQLFGDHWLLSEAALLEALLEDVG